ncbi:hypothetical protein K2173_011114 [Erythroxylum novogranatense]|uniref:Acyl-CoA oxidase C-alpha1 domain-containing protein n=1 Tax=Erythroxylum novogranatense TaxID=1862640 RepID=A0AAV8U4S7_9ROSI|nr:hypothetical protein K2173_011114 [Erythroxylum novogranatense]
MARLVASDLMFRKDNRGILSRKELFKNTVRKAAHAGKRIIELCLSGKLKLFVVDVVVVVAEEEASFIVQLRSLDDRLPLPGVIVGDIGMKFVGSGAYNAMDNCFLRFDRANPEGTNVTEVIDYKTQQSRLFPLLACAYAFRFVGEWLKWLYTDVTERLQAIDFSTLSETYACTAGLKSLTTSFTAVSED